MPRREKAPKLGAFEGSPAQLGGGNQGPQGKASQAGPLGMAPRTVCALWVRVLPFCALLSPPAEGAARLCRVSADTEHRSPGLGQNPSWFSGHRNMGPHFLQPPVAGRGS